jgi:hypothetical protein
VSVIIIILLIMDINFALDAFWYMLWLDIMT